MPPSGSADLEVSRSPATAERAFVKGFYRRPFRQGESESIRGGGRVTELTAKPLLARCVPELVGFDQPLAGEVAVRRDVLTSIPFHTGYGVEIAMLIDIWRLHGAPGIVEADMGEVQNRSKPDDALDAVTFDVIAAAALRGVGDASTAVVRLPERQHR